MTKEMDIFIGNYYGCLSVKEDNGKYYWGIEDWHGIEWGEIPRYLYKTLVKYEKERRESVEVSQCTS